MAPPKKAIDGLVASVLGAKKLEEANKPATPAPAVPVAPPPKPATTAPPQAQTPAVAVPPLPPPKTATPTASAALPPLPPPPAAKAVTPVAQTPVLPPVPPSPPPAQTTPEKPAPQPISSTQANPVALNKRFEDAEVVKKDVPPLPAPVAPVGEKQIESVANTKPVQATALTPTATGVTTDAQPARSQTVAPQPETPAITPKAVASTLLAKMTGEDRAAAAEQGVTAKPPVTQAPTAPLKAEPSKPAFIPNAILQKNGLIRVDDPITGFTTDYDEAGYYAKFGQDAPKPVTSEPAQTPAVPQLPPFLTETKTAPTVTPAGAAPSMPPDVTVPKAGPSLTVVPNAPTTTTIEPAGPLGALISTIANSWMDDPFGVQATKDAFDAYEGMGKTLESNTQAPLPSSLTAAPSVPTTIPSSLTAKPTTSTQNDFLEAPPVYTPSVPETPKVSTTGVPAPPAPAPPPPVSTTPAKPNPVAPAQASNAQKTILDKRFEAAEGVTKTEAGQGVIPPTAPAPGMMYAGGTPNFDETTGTYKNAAPITSASPVSTSVPTPTQANPVALNKRFEDAEGVPKPTPTVPPVVAATPSTPSATVTSTPNTSPTTTGTGTNTTTGGTQPPPPPTTVPPPVTSPVQPTQPTQPAQPTLPPPTTPTLPPTGGVTLPTVDGRVISPTPTAQVGIPDYLAFTPPQAGSVMERGAMPQLPNLSAGNLNAYLAGQGIGDTDLPDLPEWNLDTFQGYLNANGVQGMTEQQLAEAAKRMAGIAVNPELSQAEQDRIATAQRFQLALSQAGQGKESAVSSLDRAFNDRLKQVQAMAIRNGLTASNIPLQEDINPMVNDYNIQRRGIEESIANQIAQLSLEAALGDQDAARRIQTLKGQLGALEAQNLFDLRDRERAFGETARANRLQEYMGTEGLERQSAQDRFGNQASLAQLQEMLRGNRADEFFQQTELDNSVKQGNFANEAALAQLTEAMRQNDIQGNNDERQRYLQEWLAQNNLTSERTRLEDSLLSSNLSRRQGEMDLAQESDENSLRNQLLKAQIQESLSRAMTGGIDPVEKAQLSTEVTTASMQLFDKLRSGEMNVEQAVALRDSLMREYDAINGPGTWWARFGTAWGSISTVPRVNPTPPPSHAPVIPGLPALPPGFNPGLIGR